MEFINLFLSFIKIGFTSFGGMSMIPLMQDEMLHHGWMSTEEFSNIIAIAEMTPGPFGLNCATFAGMQVGGIIGGLTAVLGVLMPAYTLTMIVAALFARLKHSTLFEGILYVIRPICVGMLISVIVGLCITNYYSGQILSISGIVIAGIMLYLIQKQHWSVPKVIISSALLGILFYGIMGIA
ncbi:MAG: chromate transporter [Lachnospiraceae bacterium]|nr:chromate transporter [Lachnospiraceae bacterium]